MIECNSTPNCTQSSCILCSAIVKYCSHTYSHTYLMLTHTKFKLRGLGTWHYANFEWLHYQLLSVSNESICPLLILNKQYRFLTRCVCVLLDQHRMEVLQASQPSGECQPVMLLFILKVTVRVFYFLHKFNNYFKFYIKSPFTWLLYLLNTICTDFVVLCFPFHTRNIA